VQPQKGLEKDPKQKTLGGESNIMAPQATKFKMCEKVKVDIQTPDTQIPSSGEFYIGQKSTEIKTGNLLISRKAASILTRLFAVHKYKVPNCKLYLPKSLSGLQYI